MRQTLRFSLVYAPIPFFPVRP
ncbi:hypothetical protein NGA_0461300 [Nannochloropsis gaditana CCMP526]|nr:hypothetical protein NGA_0461300 [Nannochloropsis gaditana CCMP526]EKU22425.1 hypothetical protein NGA_0461300 [Nannochloropsis gaditana CCMP526]|eukprot:XP_005853936.1 hypothetical protein NGA_0461300 [Nannochloropsis gaditana CCMP526]